MKKHSGEKSRKCNLCDFSSAYSSYLRTHMKTHSGEKSNKCNQCDYASVDARALRRHLKYTVEKSQINAANVIFHALLQPI